MAKNSGPTELVKLGRGAYGLIIFFSMCGSFYLLGLEPLAGGYSQEHLAGYCRDYLWFMGMHGTFSLDDFRVMRSSLIGRHNAVITFGYAADKFIDIEDIK